MTREELRAQITELKDLYNMRSELNGMIAAIEDGIKAELIAQNTDEIAVDEHKVTWRSVTTSRFDTTAFKKELPDVAARYLKYTSGRRFLVS